MKKNKKDPYLEGIEQKNDAIDIVSKAFDEEGTEESVRRINQTAVDRRMIGTIPGNLLEYYHEVLLTFRDEIGPPSKGISEPQRQFWNQTLENISALTSSIRMLHGDWKNTRAFKLELERIKDRKERSGKLQTQKGKS